jgi:hypothetical protein
LFTTVVLDNKSLAHGSTRRACNQSVMLLLLLLLPLLLPTPLLLLLK